MGIISSFFDTATAVVDTAADAVTSVVEPVSSLVGNAIISVGDIVQISQTTPLAQQIAQSLGKAPLLVNAHYATDEALGLAYDVLNTIGEALGGEVTIDKHADDEWDGENLFSVESDPDWYVDLLNPLEFAVSAIGNTLTSVAYEGDALQDSGFFAQLGEIGNALGLESLHKGADAGLEAFYDVLNGVAELIGVDPVDTSHFDQSWG